MAKGQNILKVTIKKNNILDIYHAAAAAAADDDDDAYDDDAETYRIPLTLMTDLILNIIMSFWIFYQ